jgi:hypothetical protein
VLPSTLCLPRKSSCIACASAGKANSISLTADSSADLLSLCVRPLLRLCLKALHGSSFDLTFVLQYTRPICVRSFLNRGVPVGRTEATKRETPRKASASSTSRWPFRGDQRPSTTNLPLCSARSSKGSQSRGIGQRKRRATLFADHPSASLQASAQEISKFFNVSIHQNEKRQKAKMPFS